MYRLLKSEFEEVYKYRYVVYAFTSIKLKQRYRRSVFGYLWTVFTPIINFLIMGGVISVIARGSTVENYFFFFMSASVFFGYISNIINSTYNCLISNENFIKKIYFPKSIFIIEVVALEAINFFFTFATLLLPAVIFGFVTLKIDFFLTIFAFLLSVPLLLGIGIFVGIGAVFFRDLVHMIPAALQALYFLTPILYSPQMVPREYQFLIYWNPFYYVIESFRAPMMNYSTNYGLSFGIFSFFSFFIFFTAFLFLKRMENRIVFKL